ncbi:MAG: pyridoxal phosphate-dependent aminotransferase [Gemmataceae bacterium]|nr:pyridoxal phosphate-dependent aminotransferase [Gemmataceae bacterium]
MASMVLLLNWGIRGTILLPGMEAVRVIHSFFWRKLLVRSGLARLIPSVRRQLRGADDAIARYSDRTLAVPYAELEDFALLPAIHTPDSIDFVLGSPRCDISMSLGRSLNERRPIPPWGLLELRSDLAAEFQLNHGVEHDPNDEVLITHGATGAFASCIDAFVNPGDAAVLFDPTSPIFSIGLKHRRARVRWVPTWSDQGQLRFAMDRFAQVMRGAKLLVLADPANPTGCVLAPEDIEQIAFWARKHDVLIFQDASFDRWRSEPARTRLASLPNANARILTCGSFSKSHGLSAARVGWLTGNRHLVRPCAAAMLLTAPFVPTLCQQAAFQAMRTSESVREDFASRRANVSERLQKMGLKPWTAQAGFFLWVPVPNDEKGSDFAQRLLRETRVLVNPGSPFGPSGERFFRLSFATDAGRLREGLERLERFLANEKVRGLRVAEHLPASRGA